ncbi:MAG: hypothetical protein RLZZ242_1304 [Bacteroidota bacterium]|jgi:LPS export ABC transporter protein LptC
MLRRWSLRTYLNQATALAVALILLGCTDSFKRPELSIEERRLPAGISEQLRMYYTEAVRPLSIVESDSTRVVAILESVLNENYENRNFRFQRFPKGIEITLYNELNQPTRVIADSALYYLDTGMLNLMGNVKVFSFDQKKLYTDQLFWDRERSWVFSERPFTYENPEEGTLMKGTGMQFSRDFSTFEALKTSGVLELSESQTTNQ